MNNKKLPYEASFKMNKDWEEYKIDMKQGKKKRITQAQFNKQWKGANLPLM